MLPCTALMQQCCSSHSSYKAFGFEDFNYFDGFYPPEYAIGQVVLHKVAAVGGEILYPVIVFGCYWCGTDWEYMVQLPPTHPWFVPEDSEAIDVGEWCIEPLT